MKNKPRSWSTSFFVFFYIGLYILLTLVQAAVVLVPEYFPNLRINIGFSLPMDVFGWGLVVVIGGYVGTDRISKCFKTANMEIGTADMGNPARLRKMIWWSFIILLLNVMLGFFFDIDLPYEAVASTFVSALSLYVAGNNTIRAMQSTDMSGDKDWANEHESIIVDEDKDGVDDRIQKPCAKGSTCQDYQKV